MNLIYNLMGDKGPELIKQLTATGLGAEQAESFLPDALKSIIGGLQQVDAGVLATADSETQATSLLGKIDITSLAGHLGGDNTLASNGLRAIIPRVLGFLKDNPAAASLLGMTGNGETGGLAGLARQARGLFH